MTTTNYSLAHHVAGSGRLFTLRNGRGMAVTVSERGAALVSWWAPDRYGRMADVLLAERGDDADDDHDAYIGAVARNWNALRGIGAALWRAEVAGESLALRLALPQDAGGVEIEVRYRLDDEGRLTIDSQAVAQDVATINLGQRAQFNLNGGRGDVGDHMLQIDADHYLKIDHGGLPLGVVAVNGTPFDFRKPAAIGPRLRWPDTQIRLAGGFNHCYRLGAGGCDGLLRDVGLVYDPRSGRRLRIATTDAGLRFSSSAAPGGADAYPPGFLLEACADPGQLGSAHAAEVTLEPKRTYRRTTVYELSLQP